MKTAIFRHRAISGLLAAVLAAGLSGCAVSFSSDAPANAVQLPSDWQQPAEDGSAFASDGLWWNAFRDPLLNSLEEKALGSSRSLRAAVARMDAARAYVKESQSGMFPEADISAEASRSKTMSSSSGAISRGKIFRLQGGASWELDFWGKNRSTWEAAAADADSAYWSLQAARLSLSGSVAREYFGWLTAEENARLTGDSLVIMLKTLRIAETKFIQGTATRADLSAAKSDCDAVRAQLSALKLESETHAHALALLTADSALKLPEEAGQLPAVPQIRAGIPSEMLQNRPDVRKAAADLASARASVAVARAAFFPSVTLSGSAGTQSRSLQDLFTHSIWSFGLALDLPVFDYGKRTARHERMKANERAALETYIYTAESAYADVRDGLSGTRYYAEIEESRKAALDSAIDSLEEAQKLYASGRGSFLSLLTAQRALNTARTALASARQSALNNAVSLNLALGAQTEAP